MIITLNKKFDFKNRCPFCGKNKEGENEFPSDYGSGAFLEWFPSVKYYGWCNKCWSDDRHANISWSKTQFSKHTGLKSV